MKQKREPKKLALRRERLLQLTPIGDHQLAGVAGGTTGLGVIMSRTCRSF